jgi:hypothetical protein
MWRRPKPSRPCGTADDGSRRSLLDPEITAAPERGERSAPLGARLTLPRRRRVRTVSPPHLDRPMTRVAVGRQLFASGAPIGHPSSEWGTVSAGVLLLMVGADVAVFHVYFTLRPEYRPARRRPRSIKGRIIRLKVGAFSRHSQGFRMIFAVSCEAESSNASWIRLIGRTWLTSRSIRGDSWITFMTGGKSARL